ncbi:MAG TPA: LLM class F420-dependent oxidoreductase [Acidimicrobiia bacterium]|nr:LLM class F420-dependent oxidoreductase [Acidimicrobiia bacterium]
MHYGISMFPSRYSIGPAELARAVEERGFESLFFPEHTHIPTSRLSPWPGGADLPNEYRETFDPFLALTAAAAVTERLLLGTGICLVVERDPIITAKEVATLDVLSGGRFLFGVGGGWNREEMANHGTDPTRRFAIMRERILAMKEIWANDEAEFHGTHVDFDPVWQWPKPVQLPHPPVLVAGNGAGTIDRVLEYGDGWIPIPGRGTLKLGDGTARLQELAGERGRDRIPVTVFGARPCASVLDHYAASGVDRVLFALPPVEAAEAIKFLDNYANLAETERS